MGRGRDQADVALPFAAALVVLADRDQAGVFALGTGVRLHADRVEAGDRTEPGFQLFDHQLVTLGLPARNERMQVGELGPGDRDHLAGGVELHGAGAERDHRLVQRQVLVFQLLEVAQHLGFAVVRVEYRVAEVVALAQQRLRDSARQLAGIQRSDVEAVISTEENRQELFNGALVAGLVEADAQPAAAEDAQVDLRRFGAFDDRGLRATNLKGQGVEEMLVEANDALLFQAGSENGGQPVDALGDALEALRAVIDGIEAGDIGQQHLGGADVGVGLLAADVLLAGLQRHAQRGVAAGVLGHADDAARHAALELVAAGEIGRVRATVAHRHAEALGRAEHHVGAQFARRGQQQKAEQIGGDAGQRLLRMQLLNGRTQVANLAMGIRVLQQRAEHFLSGQLVQRANHQLETERLGAGLHHGERLRMAVLLDEEAVALALGHAPGQGHGLRRCGAFIQQRSVGQIEPGEIDDHLLIVQQRFQTALGDFRLIGRVGGVPTGVLQHVAQDHRRGDGAVVTHADQAGPELILLRIPTQLGQRGLLVQRRRQVQLGLQADRRRHGLLDQLFAAAQAQGVEHGLLFALIRAEVTAQEGIGLLELGKARHIRHGRYSRKNKSPDRAGLLRMMLRRRRRRQPGNRPRRAACPAPTYRSAAGGRTSCRKGRC